MRKFTGMLVLAGVALGIRAFPADSSPSALLPTVGDPVKAGQELAAKLRRSPPPADSKLTGTLRVLPREGESRPVPVVCTVKLEASSNSAPRWEVAYRTKAVGPLPEEALTVRFCAGRSNEYFFAQGEAAAKVPADATRRPNHATETPLAGSDFWLCDLGLEFLHWPTQRVIKTEMRRSQPCRVLESVNPQPSPAGYSRVVSWVALFEPDGEGILQAEAYDRSNKLLKEFSLGSFKKIDGEWQLQDMRIRNVQSRSRTWLEFDLKKSPAAAEPR